MHNTISRREFLDSLGKGTMLLGAIHSGILGWSRSGKKKPNVLMIIVDDLRPELGCYGANHIHSPHIDELASEGLLFTKAYVQQAVCAASRASVLTGCRPDTTGVDFPYTEWFMRSFLPFHPDIQTYFSQKGYYTVTSGKVHHGDENNPAYSEPHYTSQKPDWVGEHYRHDAPKPCVEMLDRPDSAYKDGDLTNNAIERLQAACIKKAPFFMAVGYRKPHLPFVCPKKYADFYDRRKIDLSPVPQFPEKSPSYSHPGLRYQDKTGSWILEGNSALHKVRYIQKPDGLTEEYQRELTHGYYACVSFVDAQIGRLITELKTLGIWDNTVIVLWGDHGFHLGDHNWWTKRSNCEFDTRIPLVFRVPGQRTGGQKTDALVEAVDISPTLLDACGFPIPEYMEGTSVMPLIENPERQWKKAAFSQYPRGQRGSESYKEGYSIRTQHFRYTEWRDNDGKVLAREFYDEIEDPLESKNVIHEIKYRDFIRQHEKMLTDGWQKALPPGIVNNANNPKGDDSEYL